MTHGTHLFGLSNVLHADLETEMAAVVVVAASSFLSVTCCGEAFPSQGVQVVEGMILVGALFPLDGGEEEKERKKNCHEEGGFPGAGPTLLAVQWVSC
jgi:hypothetical protein